MRSLIGGTVALVLLALSPLAHAADQKGLVDQVHEGCRAELETHCKDVTPGEGRLLACLYAYEDKLSSRCDFALYDASMRLERAAAAFAHGATECHADIQKHCAGVQSGEGRILDCLQQHKSRLSKRCQHAFTDLEHS